MRPDLSVIREHLSLSEAVQAVIDILSKDALDVWIYADTDWCVDRVTARTWIAKSGPSSFRRPSSRHSRVYWIACVKIVGVSDDHEAMARCVDGRCSRRVGHHVSAALSQPYYLDVTHPKANKGEVITALSALLAIPTAQIATIGDMPNDVLMFERSGVSIAMANASAEVQRAAKFVTTSNTEEGFALAMERFVLGARTACTKVWSNEYLFSGTVRIVDDHRGDGRRRIGKNDRGHDAGGCDALRVSRRRFAALGKRTSRR